MSIAESDTPRGPSLERTRRDIAQLTLMDDAFFEVAMNQDIAAAEVPLRAFLQRDDLTVLEATTQHRIGNLDGRSVELDLLAKDETGTLYDVEI